MKIAFCSIALLLLTLPVFSQSKEKIDELKEEAEAAKSALMEANPEIKEFFDSAAGYVIFPNVGKGGFVIGGAAGSGILYENGKQVGYANLKELNIGLQAGGQAVIEAIFFETPETLEKFKGSEFSFNAGLSAVALKEGESFNARYTEGVAVFMHTKGGLMAEASVGGQKFKYKPFDKM
ncbi:lipid-binding SYLF domain-containing protein [Robertkochia aurantiaca]|uniref:lipid-binding SYLF domain-containing protein n=1 Tax=Robertkochia aurantiaca TaxID=2873700 RepID=UPI001CCDA9D8|nr:lipid-binding SYLF domain-containing protein [Robertkochia sp. 3YJGBD-33]